MEIHSFDIRDFMRLVRKADIELTITASGNGVKIEFSKTKPFDEIKWKKALEVAIRLNELTIEKSKLFNNTMVEIVSPF